MKLFHSHHWKVIGTEHWYQENSRQPGKEFNQTTTVLYGCDCGKRRTKEFRGWWKTEDFS